MSEKKKTKDFCAGCYNDDYNRGLGGSKECWSYESAKIINRIAIPIDQAPPYNKENAKPMLDCYNKKRMVYVKPSVLNDDGYWK